MNRNVCECCGQTLPSEQQEEFEGDTMIFLNGNTNSFHCDNPVGYRGEQCGCNVFRKSKTVPMHYKCNACGATFTGGL